MQSYTNESCPTLSLHSNLAPSMLLKKCWMKAFMDQQLYDREAVTSGLGTMTASLLQEGERQRESK